LAFCTSVAHAHATAAAFQAAGYRAAALDGTMKPELRARLIDELGSGALQVLTNCQLITEGTDITGVHTGIILRPTASLGLHLQILGRMLRLAPGKPFATILDHAGNCIKHGLANESRNWTLEGKKQFKKTAKDSIGSITVCPNCYACMASALQCMFCGHVIPKKERTTKEIEGELAEISARRAEALKIERAREQAKAKTLADLQALAKRRGHSSQWAVNVLRARKRK
jgi:superfamily II DNA or RNA helicase